ncbi:MAG: alpha-amylase family glycosyl hydrolase [Candidatus Thorarchaeota archaeon]
MLKSNKHPLIFEINTFPWLNTLSEIFGHTINLNNIPLELIDQELAVFDAIWCMGVWERSPKGRNMARNDENLQKEYHKALRYYNTDDVIGSPYAVYYYHVDSHIGGSEGLASFRKDLASRNISLLLDYVPNHVAVDHIWTLEKSDMFVKGTMADLMQKPFEYFSVGQEVYANGRDPNFPPWTDTVQINAFSQVARDKALNTLLSIAEQCDGVRCDMAMLMTNKVFKQTWGDKVGDEPETEFWEEIIPPIKEKFPNFKFIAEVYWDMEWELMQQGFDYCYDKQLYERLANENAKKVVEYLQADWDYQIKLLRFIENHDEPRAVTVFGEEASKAAATIALTLPGAKLIYEGQMRGYEIKVPVQLGKNPNEDDNLDLMNFYEKLIKAIPGGKFSDGHWSLCESTPVGGDERSYKNLVAYQWWNNTKRRVIIVNYSLRPSKAHIKIEHIDYGNSKWQFNDLLSDKKYSYIGEDLTNYGLYVELEPWRGHIFEVTEIN